MQTAGSASETRNQAIDTTEICFFPSFTPQVLTPTLKVTQFQPYLKGARTQIQIWVPDNRAVYTVQCDKTDLLRMVTERLDYK